MRRSCSGLLVRIAYGTSTDRPEHPPKPLTIRQLRYFSSGCGRYGHGAAARRSGLAAPAGGGSPRRAGSRDRPRRQAGGGPAARRAARRAPVRLRAGDRRLHPADARRGRPGHREDRGLDHVRRDEHLRQRPPVGLGAAGRLGRQRDAARHDPAPRQRRVLGRPRHLPRPPQRRQLLHQPAGRAGRLRDQQRGESQQRLEPGVGRPHGALRRRLDGGDGDPVQVAALSARSRPGLGRAAAAHHPAQERAGLPDAAADLRGAHRHLPRLAGGHAGGPGSAGRGRSRARPGSTSSTA